MVYHVAEPEQVYLVAHAVRPVIAEIDTEEAKQNPIPGCFQIENSKTGKNKMVCRYRKNLGKYAGKLLYNSATHIGKCIVEPVNLFVFKISISNLHPDKDKKNGNGKNYRIEAHEM